MLLLFMLFTSVSVPTSAGSSTPLKRHWQETDSETLWTVRYTNCDYGFYVLLDPGVVAHDTLPPSPNHGFVIPLPDFGRTSYALNEKKRFVWVDASYDTSDDGTGQSVLTGKTGIMSSSVKGISTKLAGLPAIASTLQESAPSGEEIKESVVAVRSGIVYTIGLQTTPAGTTMSGNFARYATVSDCLSCRRENAATADRVKKVQCLPALY
jgi:hypothetical protein